jgi:transposase-like protein
MQTNDRVERLKQLYIDLGGEPTSTERQHARRGDFPDEATVDERLGRVVERMRERYGFRTSLDRPALVAVVRGYYAGRSDAEVADRLGVSPETVARARVNLHLFRPADTEARFDVDALRTLLDGGANVADAAAELGVAPTTAGEYARVLRVQQEARVSGYRYPEEFEELLEVDTERLGRTYRTDRRTMEEVVD